MSTVREVERRNAIADRDQGHGQLPAKLTVPWRRQPLLIDAVPVPLVNGVTGETEQRAACEEALRYGFAAVCVNQGAC